MLERLIISYDIEERNSGISGKSLIGAHNIAGRNSGLTGNNFTIL